MCEGSNFVNVTGVQLYMELVSVNKRFVFSNVMGFRGGWVLYLDCERSFIAKVA